MWRQNRFNFTTLVTTGTITGRKSISEEFNDVGSMALSFVMDEDNDLRGSIVILPVGGLLESWDSSFLSEQIGGSDQWAAPNED